MYLKEAIIKGLEDLGTLANHVMIYEHILEKSYYDFAMAKTPKATISAQLGEFIRKNDTRVKRVKGKSAVYYYYLAKNEQDLNVEEFSEAADEAKEIVSKKTKTYLERDLHKLLSTYLKSQNSYSKTIFHEQSTYRNDGHQKWAHPDLVSISFLNLTSKANQSLMKVLNKTDTFKISSYEIKKEISTDYELKKTYFQAVSNSSWANYGYLVALDISSSLNDEMERLNDSFGIGIIELKANPYESKVLYQAKYKELDFKTIDKLCKINKTFEDFIELTEKILTATDRYIKPTKQELESFCDSYFSQDSEIEKYCISKNIPNEQADTELQ
jgi:hypothetical protein